MDPNKLREKLAALEQQLQQKKKKIQKIEQAKKRKDHVKQRIQEHNNCEESSKCCPDDIKKRNPLVSFCLETNKNISEDGTGGPKGHSSIILDPFPEAPFSQDEFKTKPKRTRRSLPAKFSPVHQKSDIRLEKLKSSNPPDKRKVNLDISPEKGNTEPGNKSKEAVVNSVKRRDKKLSEKKKEPNKNKCTLESTGSPLQQTQSTNKNKMHVSENLVEIQEGNPHYIQSYEDFSMVPSSLDLSKKRTNLKTKPEKMPKPMTKPKENSYKSIKNRNEKSSIKSIVKEDKDECTNESTVNLSHSAESANENKVDVPSNLDEIQENFSMIPSSLEVSKKRTKLKAKLDKKKTSNPICERKTNLNVSLEEGNMKLKNQSQENYNKDTITRTSNPSIKAKEVNKVQSKVNSPQPPESGKDEKASVSSNIKAKSLLPAGSGSMLDEIQGENSQCLQAYSDFSMVPSSLELSKKRTKLKTKRRSLPAALGRARVTKQITANVLANKNQDNFQTEEINTESISKPCENSITQENLPDEQAKTPQKDKKSGVGIKISQTSVECFTYKSDKSQDVQDPRTMSNLEFVNPGNAPNAQITNPIEIKEVENVSRATIPAQSVDEKFTKPTAQVTAAVKSKRKSRRSEPILDFSYLYEDESDDMYSQIKTRRRRSRCSVGSSQLNNFSQDLSQGSCLTSSSNSQMDGILPKLDLGLSQGSVTSDSNVEGKDSFIDTASSLGATCVPDQVSEPQNSNVPTVFCNALTEPQAQPMQEIRAADKQQQIVENVTPSLPSSEVFTDLETHSAPSQSLISSKSDFPDISLVSSSHSAPPSFMRSPITDRTFMKHPIKSKMKRITNFSLPGADFAKLKSKKSKKLSANTGGSATLDSKESRKAQGNSTKSSKRRSYKLSPIKKVPELMFPVFLPSHEDTLSTTLLENREESLGEGDPQREEIDGETVIRQCPEPEIVYLKDTQSKTEDQHVSEKKLQEDQTILTEKHVVLENPTSEISENSSQSQSLIRSVKKKKIFANSRGTSHRKRKDQQTEIQPEKQFGTSEELVSISSDSTPSSQSLLANVHDNILITKTDNHDNKFNAAEVSQIELSLNKKRRRNVRGKRKTMQTLQNLSEVGDLQNLVARSPNEISPNGISCEYYDVIDNTNINEVTINDKTGNSLEVPSDLQNNGMEGNNDTNLIENENIEIKKCEHMEEIKVSPGGMDHDEMKTSQGSLRQHEINDSYNGINIQKTSEDICNVDQDKPTKQKDVNSPENIHGLNNSFTSEDATSSYTKYKTSSQFRLLGMTNIEPISEVVAVRAVYQSIKDKRGVALIVGTPSDVKLWWLQEKPVQDHQLIHSWNLEGELKHLEATTNQNSIQVLASGILRNDGTYVDLLPYKLFLEETNVFRLHRNTDSLVQETLVCNASNSIIMADIFECSSIVSQISSLDTNEEKIMMGEIDERLSSIAPIKGQEKAVMGVSDKSIYIWNRQVNLLLLKIDISADLIGPCFYSASDKGLLFLWMSSCNKQPSLVVVNPHTQKSVLACNLEVPTGTESLHLHSVNEDIFATNGEKTFGTWNTLTGECVAVQQFENILNGTVLSTEDHDRRVVIISKSFIACYRTDSNVQI